LAELDKANRADQERLRALHAERQRKPLLALGAARANRTPISWRPEDVATPSFSGLRAVEPSVAELRPYIDWQFFFHAWDIKGRYPAVLEQPAARSLYDDANALLCEIEARDLLEPCGVFGFWPARAEGDDILLDGVRLPMLRQQADFGDSRPNRSLADYVAPADAGLDDHAGAFAVAIHRADELAAVYAAEDDDYRAITVKALADRLAEAFAEWLHERARREWYDPSERLTDDDLHRERFRGIRPAFGYPACPDHSEKRTLFDLLDAGRAGLALTESCAMTPAAAVSGILLGHPSARYFSIGRVGQDQVSDYAARKEMTLQEAERWLAPNLAYDPERA
jgi:5-methyltetrahydrofolate--homocysteine methyltransferase